MTYKLPLFSLVATVALLSIRSSMASEESNENTRCWFVANFDLHPNAYPHRFCVENGCNRATNYADWCRDQGHGARRILEEDAGAFEANVVPHHRATMEVDHDHGMDMEETEPSKIKKRFAKECLAEPYIMFLLVVEGHLFLSALPTDQQLGCPNLVAQTSFRTDDDGAYDPTKHLATIGRELAEYALVQGHYVGTLELDAFLEAYNKAMVVIDDGYNVMGNNCSIFIQSMLKLLGYELTTEIKDFVVDGLMRSDTLMTTMKDAMEGGQGQRTLGASAQGMRFLAQMGGRDMVSYIVQNNIDQFEDFLHV